MAQVVTLVLLIVLFVVMFPVAALDAVRFHWSSVPLWLVVVGYLLLLMGMAGNVWVLSVNKFAEPSVRIQTERGQRVVDTGPYAIVRHPMYSAAILSYAAIPLALGSRAGLLGIPLPILVLAVRILFEEALLKRELPGYCDYMAKVRYRLLPLIW